MLKVMTWNVNSLPVRIERLTGLLLREKPDIVCLQELKCEEPKYPQSDLEKLGYHSVMACQKTYNGVAILSKSPPNHVRVGFSNGSSDPQMRLASAEIRGIQVLCVYVPNGQAVGTDKFSYKLDWFQKLRKHLNCHFDPSSPLLVCGDFNVAPENRDVYDPAAWEGKILFSKPEKSALQELTNWGLTDTFRIHHEGEGLYSWWDYRTRAFPRNHGLRIDFILASKPLAKLCRSSRIDREERKSDRPSDHAPVFAEFDTLSLSHAK